MEFLLCCLDFLSIQISNEQKADEKYNKALADEFYTAQSKMLAYLSIMGKIREVWFSSGISLVIFEHFVFSVHGSDLSEWWQVHQWCVISSRAVSGWVDSREKVSVAGFHLVLSHCPLYFASETSSSRWSSFSSRICARNLFSCCRGCYQKSLWLALGTLL